MSLEEIAHRMFVRNVEDYAEPALTELAWIDPEIQQFWIAQAQAVLADFAHLTGHAVPPVAEYWARVDPATTRPLGDKPSAR